jgi:hypothetical protein
MKYVPEENVTKKKNLKDTYLICKQEKKLMSNVMKEKKIERYLSHCKQGKKNKKIYRNDEKRTD